MLENENQSQCWEHSEGEWAALVKTRPFNIVAWCAPGHFHLGVSASESVCATQNCLLTKSSVSGSLTSPSIASEEGLVSSLRAS